MKNEAHVFGVRLLLRRLRAGKGITKVREFDFEAFLEERRGVMLSHSAALVPPDPDRTRRSLDG